jgi:hypothetical protein
MFHTRRTYVMHLLEVAVYICYEPPHKGKCCPAKEEGECTEEKRVSPLHIHNSGHRILDKAPCMLGQVVWIKVALAILEHCSVVPVFGPRWCEFISHRYPCILKHPYAVQEKRKHDITFNTFSRLAF